MQQELMTLMTSGQKGISAFPEGDKLFAWVATVEGPQESVYAGEEEREAKVLMIRVFTEGQNQMWRMFQ